MSTYKQYLVETVYLSAWCSHSTSATVILLMSSFLIPRLDPFIVTKICPLLGPNRGVIWSKSMGMKKFRTGKLYKVNCNKERCWRVFKKLIQCTLGNGKKCEDMQQHDPIIMFVCVLHLWWWEEGTVEALSNKAQNTCRSAWRHTIRSCTSGLRSYTDCSPHGPLNNYTAPLRQRVWKRENTSEWRARWGRPLCNFCKYVIGEKGASYIFSPTEIISC